MSTPCDKVKYWDEQQAERALAGILHKKIEARRYDRLERSFYYCKTCFLWHLTSLEPGRPYPRRVKQSFGRSKHERVSRALQADHEGIYWTRPLRVLSPPSGPYEEIQDHWYVLNRIGRLAVFAGTILRERDRNMALELAENIRQATGVIHLPLIYQTA